jgi:deferrochelatase/peroxidase EfeB
MEYDAGLLFVSYQKDPRAGFIKIFDQMSKLDQMNQFVTRTGGGLFGCPRGITKGEYLVQSLLESA